MNHPVWQVKIIHASSCVEQHVESAAKGSVQAENPQLVVNPNHVASSDFKPEECLFALCWVGVSDHQERLEQPWNTSPGSGRSLLRKATKYTAV